MTIANLNDAAELRDWIRFMQTDGVGVEMARRLLSTFGLPGDIFSASFDEVRAVAPERIARGLLQPLSAMMQNRIDASLDWAAQPGHRILTLSDTDYPQALLNIPDPPILLYIKGRSELLSATSLAVVGSRNATVQGMQNAERFSEAASRAALTVVSGLALGIDAAAHHGGLRGSGSSIAVIGTGIDIVYPMRNRALAQRLAEEGCIVSEYPLGMPPVAANFPRRNRIISGLARAVLVVEAAAQSGSLITARTAAEQGRDVFAIPGSIHSPLSKGCHQLIKQGAKLIESEQDILEELGKLPLLARRAQAPVIVRADSDTDGLLGAMGFDPVDADALSMRSGLGAAALSERLLSLELDGAVECLPGGRYRRVN